MVVLTQTHDAKADGISINSTVSSIDLDASRNGEIRTASIIIIIELHTCVQVGYCIFIVQFMNSDYN